jgi:hypothetical protein
MATFSSLMGHTRQPTIGAVTKENSHPFEIGNIIGAHNGMVSNWKMLEDKYPERKPFAVDSMHIFAHLNEGKDMKELQCYGAIEWIERALAPGHILLCKLTDGGDLEIARTEHGIVWSSAKTALMAALDAAEIDVEEMVEVKRGHVIELHDGEAWGTDREIEVSTYYRTSYAATSGGSHSYYNDSDYQSWWGTNAASGARASAGSSDTCESQMCGSPLDANGDCTVMFDDKCTGAAAGIINKGKTAVLTRMGLSQPPSCKEVMQDSTVKAICVAECEMCKSGAERDGAGWHNGMDGTMKVSRLCKGPEYHIASLYVRTIALFKTKTGTVEESLRERFKLAKKAWGWVMSDDGKPWTLPDYYKTLKSMECRFCHNMRMEKSVKGLCESCEKRHEDDRICLEEGCLATPQGKGAEYCSRHGCAGSDCKKQSGQTSLYCDECREKRRILAEVKPQPSLPETAATAAENANCG